MTSTTHSSSQLEPTHGRDMPSLLHVADDLLGSEPRYPTRRNRTAAATPPIVVHRVGVSTRRTAASGNLSPIVDSPPLKRRVNTTYANDLNYSDDDNDFLLCDDDVNDDAHDIEYMETKKKTSRYRRRGNLILGGPPQQDTSTMTESEKRHYRKLRKEYTDRLRCERMRRKPSDSGSLLPGDEFTGDSSPTLRPESKVQTDPLQVGHSFASKSTLIMRVAEEANLRGIDFKTVRSDVLSFKCVGLRFGVEAYHSELNGWRVKVCATREGDDYNGVDVCSDDELALTPPKSPYRTTWIKDLIMDIIAECPSATNQTLRQF